MNTPSRLSEYSNGIVLFSALGVGYLVGSQQEETAQQVELIVRKPYTGEVLPLQNARGIPANTTIAQVSFKPAENTIFTALPLQDAIKTETVPQTNNINIVRSTTGNTIEFSATCPNDAIIAVRKKMLELLDRVDTKKIGLKNPSTITYTEQRLDDGTTKVAGSIASIEQ